VTYAIYGSRIFKLAKEFRFFASDKSGGMRIILGCRGGECFLGHQIAVGVDYEEGLAVRQWRRDESGFLLGSTVTMTLADAGPLFRNKRPSFTLHHLTKRHQATVYRMYKEEVDSDTIVIHFNFDENYCCASQDQIQAAYYEQRLVSILTYVTHSQHLMQKLVILSDNIDHTNKTILVYLIEVFEVGVILKNAV
jgi:hypothetical protein